MKSYLFTFLLMFVFVGITAQTDNYQKELQNLSDLSLLPQYRSGEVEQFSSYDRTGWNDDGFSGKFSFLRKEADGMVIAEMKGAGVVNRIWTPTPTTDTIQFFFDGEKKPRISVPFIELFKGGPYPFISPICGNEIGGYYCYLPIPYEKSLKVVFKGPLMKFYQLQYRSLSDKEKMKTFSFDNMNKYKESFDNVANTWNRKASPVNAYQSKLKTKKINLTLRPGVQENIFDMNHGGRIVGIEFGASSDLIDAFRKVMLAATWDNESKKALDLPLHDYFGFAFGKPSMQSLMLGSDAAKLYSYMPMPYDNSAKITLTYDRLKQGDPQELNISGTIYYTDDKRDAKTEGKFYAQSRREYNPPIGESYLMSDVKGKGHFVGAILVAQGLKEGMTLYWEGDDCITIDGRMRMHGTGTEDYFNGGWYAVADRWDWGVSLPLHGSLLYDLKTGRTGGYRMYMADKMNFEKSLNFMMEHGPDKNNIEVDYSSVCFFYAENPQYENADIRIDEKVKKVYRRDIMTPQGMFMTLYWNTTASFDDPALVVTSRKSEYWMANIDFEAVPMVQIDLAGYDKGRYKVSVAYEKTENGKPFTVWQRTNPISGWIDTKADGSSEEVTIANVGEVIVSDQIRTLTLRRHKDDETTVKIRHFIFEKINE